MTPTHSTHHLIHSFFSDGQLGPLFHGIMIRTVRQVAHQSGAKRWKQAPAGTGTNVGLLELHLRAHGLCLYSPLANLAAGKNGTIMATGVLQYLHADDLVITLDSRYQQARDLADGVTTLTTPLDDNALRLFRGDAIRAAAFNDANRVCQDILEPRLWEVSPI